MLRFGWNIFFLVPWKNNNLPQIKYRNHLYLSTWDHMPNSYKGAHDVQINADQVKRSTYYVGRARDMNFWQWDLDLSGKRVNKIFKFRFRFNSWCFNFFYVTLRLYKWFNSSPNSNVAGNKHLIFWHLTT